jgi:hypothetical protein
MVIATRDGRTVAAQFHSPAGYCIAAKLHVGTANPQAVADLGIRGATPSPSPSAPCPLDRQLE